MVKMTFVDYPQQCLSRVNNLRLTQGDWSPDQIIDAARMADWRRNFLKFTQGDMWTARISISRGRARPGIGGNASF